MYRGGGGASAQAMHLEVGISTNEAPLPKVLSLSPCRTSAEGEAEGDRKPPTLRGDDPIPKLPELPPPGDPHGDAEVEAVGADEPRSDPQKSPPAHQSAPCRNLLRGVVTPSFGPPKPPPKPSNEAAGGVARRPARRLGEGLWESSANL